MRIFHDSLNENCQNFESLVPIRNASETLLSNLKINWNEIHHTHHGWWHWNDDRIARGVRGMNNKELTVVEKLPPDSRTKKKTPKWNELYVITCRLLTKRPKSTTIERKELLNLIYSWIVLCCVCALWLGWVK